MHTTTFTICLDSHIADAEILVTVDFEYEPGEGSWYSDEPPVGPSAEARKFTLTQNGEPLPEAAQAWFLKQIDDFALQEELIEAAEDQLQAEWYEYQERQYQMWKDQRWEGVA